MRTSENNHASLRNMIINSALDKTQKKYLLDIVDGTRIAPLTSDTMAKHLYSPDLNPKRFDNLMARIMKDPTIKSRQSAANELPVEHENAKRTITDLSSWLSDNRFATLEVQAIAQEFSFNRFDIYTSRILFLQYSVNGDQKKSELNYENVNGVILVVLMRDSPAFLKISKTKRYIHRFTHAVSDSGVRIPMLRKIAFVQLDKALEQFLDNSYNEDEDLFLLSELAMLADVNNESVKEAVMKQNSLKELYCDAEKFSQNIDVQLMLLAEEFAEYDRQNALNKATEKGIEIGEKRGINIGIDQINDLYSWLYSNGREEDVKKALTDPVFREELLKEYSKSINAIN